MSETPVLGLPEIAEGVASQTVLHNQALRLIEARIVRVLSRTTTAPPGSPAEGDSYIVPAGATGAWSGLTDQVASFVGGGWVYLTPGEGVRLWVNDADETIVFDGAAWVLSEGSAGGGSGDVVGPASSTDGHFATYDGATGKLLKDTLALDTDTTLAADSDTRVASQKAVKAYVGASGGGAPRLDQITPGTANSTLTTTGTVSLTSGVGAANTAGKTLSLQPGAGGATTAAGGLLSLTGGTGTGNGIAGGAVTITGGAAAGTATTGGAVNLAGGTGVSGGAISIASGASTTTGTAGAIAITAASGAGSNAIGGAVTMTAGASTNAQVGGVVTITAGAGGSTGGAVTVRGGGGVIGGAVSVLGGTPTAGAGGAVNVTGAAGVGTNMAGGNVILRPGAATGSGNPGNIQLDGGRGAAIATTATGGFVTLPTCAGTPTGTPVNVPTGSVATIVDTSGGKLWMFIGGAWKGYVNTDEVQNVTNRIINGKFAIDQRNAGAAVTINNNSLYSLDRWVGNATVTDGAFSMFQSVDMPRAGEFAMTMQATTADATLTAGELYFISQYIEGRNVAEFNLGSAAAKPFTLAFEVATSIAGTFPVSFRNTAADRSYVTTFTTAAGGSTFTTVAVTVPGDVTGTWDKVNSVGLRVGIALGAGTTFNAPAANTWQTGNFLSVAGCTNLMGTASATIRLANVRLYKGSVDFGPDRRLYAEELALCQRYYQCSDVTGGPGATFRATKGGSNYVWFSFATTMRTDPIMSTGTVTYNGSATSGAAISQQRVSGAEVAFSATIPDAFVIVPWTASAEL